MVDPKRVRRRDELDPSYTKRDKEEIENYLRELGKELSEGRWTSDDAADIGNVLVNLMATMGDMINLYMDKQALEAFLVRARERKNVISHLKPLMGKIRPPVPPKVTQRFYADHNRSIIIPKFYTVTNEGKLDRLIEYHTIEETSIEPSEGGYVDVEAIEGRKVDLGRKYRADIDEFNRIFLNVDDISYRATDVVIDGEQWYEVDSVNLVMLEHEIPGYEPEDQRVYAIEEDREGDFFVRLRPSWQSYVDDPDNVNIDIRYITTTGSTIGAEVLTRLTESLYDVPATEEEEPLNVIDIVTTVNHASSLGYEPEQDLDTATYTAIKDASRMGLNVTLQDYKAYLDNYPGIAKGAAYDWTSMWRQVIGEALYGGYDYDKEPVSMYLLTQPFKIYLPIAMEHDVGGEFEEPPKPSSEYLFDLEDEMNRFRVSYQELHLRYEQRFLLDENDEPRSDLWLSFFKDEEYSSDPDDLIVQVGDPLVIYQPVNLMIRLTVPYDFKESDRAGVSYAVTQRMLEFFRPIHHEFGRHIHLSSINAAILGAHEGILHAFIKEPECLEEHIRMKSPFHFPYLKSVDFDWVKEDEYAYYRYRW